MGLIANFDVEPAEGTRITLDEQVYELVGVEPYIRITDGKPSRLLVWETTCPTPGCGRGFRTNSAMAVTSLRRRCDEHAKSTKVVKGRRGRRLKVKVEIA